MMKYTPGVPDVSSMPNTPGVPDVIAGRDIPAGWTEVQIRLNSMEDWDEVCGTVRGKQIMVTDEIERMGIVPRLPGTRLITLRKARHAPERQADDRLSVERYDHLVFVNIIERLRGKGAMVMRWA